MKQLPFQLNWYINELRNDDNFKNLRSLAELSMMLVKERKVSRYDIVYKLLKLVLLLPVATAGVEMIFSIMNFVKTSYEARWGRNFWMVAWSHSVKGNSSSKLRIRILTLIFKPLRIEELNCRLKFVSFFYHLLFYPLFILLVCRTISSYAMINAIILILNYMIWIYALGCQIFFTL